MISLRTRAVVIASSSAVLLAGCSIASAPVHTSSSIHNARLALSQSLGYLALRARVNPVVWQANPGQGWVSQSLPPHLVYVADEGGQTVYIFPQFGRDQAPIGKITSGLAAPNGLFVDASGTLYVCNFGGGTVTEYHRGKVTPFRTLTGAGSAIDVVVGLDGTVYVADWDSGTQGRLLEYEPKHTAPSTTIGVNGAPEGLALDQSNDVYMAYNDATAGDGEVLEFAPGSTVGTNLGIHIGYAGGATIDSGQNLLLVDQNVPGVDVFPPGATQPSEQIKGFSLAFDIALTGSDERLWVTDPFVAVNEVLYPSGKQINSIQNTISSAFGVATDPHGSF